MKIYTSHQDHNTNYTERIHFNAKRQQSVYLSSVSRYGAGGRVPGAGGYAMGVVGCCVHVVLDPLCLERRKHSVSQNRVQQIHH